MPSDTQKLRILRASTDHDLLALVQRDLNRGLNAVALATSRNSPLFSQALKAHVTATTLLPRIANLSKDDRLCMDAKIKQLRSRLEQVPAFANTASIPASFAS
jgi:hypothetical protein